MITPTTGLERIKTSVAALFKKWLSTPWGKVKNAFKSVLEAFKRHA